MLILILILFYFYLNVKNKLYKEVNKTKQ